MLGLTSKSYSRKMQAYPFFQPTRQILQTFFGFPNPFLNPTYDSIPENPRPLWMHVLVSPFFYYTTQQRYHNVFQGSGEGRGEAGEFKPCPWPPSSIPAIELHILINIYIHKHISYVTNNCWLLCCYQLCRFLWIWYSAIGLSRDF